MTNVIKPFVFVIYEWANQLVFVPGWSFQPSLYLQKGTSSLSRLVRFARDEHFTLFGTCVDYDSKKLCNIDPIIQIQLSLLYLV